MFHMGNSREFEGWLHSDWLISPENPSKQEVKALVASSKFFFAVQHNTQTVIVPCVE